MAVREKDELFKVSKFIKFLRWWTLEDASAALAFVDLRSRGYLTETDQHYSSNNLEEELQKFSNLSKDARSLQLKAKYLQTIDTLDYTLKTQTFTAKLLLKLTQNVNLVIQRWNTQKWFISKALKLRAKQTSNISVITSRTCTVWLKAKHSMWFGTWSLWHSRSFGIASIVKVRRR